MLEQGETNTGSDVFHVDCTANGLGSAPATPVFQPGRIVLQQVRQNSPTFNAALIAFVEAHRDEDADKNRLCPPNPYPRSIDDWPGLSRRTWQVEQRWLGEPDVSGWVAASRLDLPPGGSPTMPPSDRPFKAAIERFLTHVGPATERLREPIGCAHPDRCDLRPHRVYSTSDSLTVAHTRVKRSSSPTGLRTCASAHCCCASVEVVLPYRAIAYAE